MSVPGFVWKGKTLLSGIDPAGRACRAADAIVLKDRTLYLCPSPLYGYGLERLSARLAAGASGSAILCVEADPELYDIAVKNIDIKNDIIHITDRREPAALCSFMRQTWGSRNFRRVEMIRFSGGWQLFPDLYNSLLDALRREIALDWSNALTLTKLGRRYMRNAMRNLALIPSCPPLTELSFGESPTLVLGAGPSLDSLLDGLSLCFGAEIEKPEERPFRIVCVDTCLPSLHDRGIVPDLAVILESQHWNLRDFTGLKGWKVNAAMDLSALPASGRVLGGGLYLFMTPWTEMRIFARLKAAGLLPPVIMPLGSVGLCALEIARRLTRGNIVSGGIDFSFSLDAYHARSTPGHKDRLGGGSRFQSLLNTAAAFGEASFSARSKAGLSVRSNPAMRNYRALFEQEFALDPRLFDLADSGLPLGIKTLEKNEAFCLLEADLPEAGEAENARGFAHNGNAVIGEKPPIAQNGLAEKLGGFLREEAESLVLLRSVLAGGAPEGTQTAERLDALIDDCDYLWAHFPDYAGAGDRRPSVREIAAGTPAAVSFLKRIRAEIDPFLKIVEGLPGTAG